MLGVSDSDLLGNSVWSFEGGVVGVMVGDQDGEKVGSSVSLSDGLSVGDRVTGLIGDLNCCQS
jgi:hypothetical protein